MSDGDIAAGAPASAPSVQQVPIGAISATFLRQRDFAAGEALRLANDVDQLLAALRAAAEREQELAARLEDAERQAATLYQSIQSRDAVIAERDAEILRLKTEPVVIPLQNPSAGDDDGA